MLVELGGADGPAMGRVVFEVKDKKLSKNIAWQELNEAMAARAASYGVLVVAGEERVPAGREQLREYEGNKLIVAVDREEPESLALSVAYRLAAARVSMARDRDLTVDAAEVRAVAEEAIVVPAAGAGDQVDPDGHPDVIREGRERARRDGRGGRARSSSGSTLWSRRPTPPLSPRTKAREAAARSGRSGAWPRPTRFPS